MKDASVFHFVATVGCGCGIGSGLSRYTLSAVCFPMVLIRS